MTRIRTNEKVHRIAFSAGENVGTLVFVPFVDILIPGLESTAERVSTNNAKQDERKELDRG
jgi:hypothetical protein